MKTQTKILYTWTYFKCAVIAELKEHLQLLKSTTRGALNEQKVQPCGWTIHIPEVSVVLFVLTQLIV